MPSPPETGECGDACDTLQYQIDGLNKRLEEYRLREWACYQALGYGEPTNEALPHLIECMMGLKARLQDSLDSIERATGFQPGTEPLSTWVERMVKERGVAQAKCAEMREVLQTIRGIIPHPVWGENVSKILHLAEHALSTDCGNGYVPRAELDRLKAVCAELRDALLPFGCETCNGSHVFTFECPGCLSGDGECTCKDQKPEPCPQCQQFEASKRLYGRRERALAHAKEVGL